MRVLKVSFIGGHGKLLPFKYRDATDIINSNSKINLSINELNKNIKVSINNLSDSLNSSYRLFVHCRSIPLYFGKISQGKDVILSYDSLSQGGIYSFQLLDSKLKNNCRKTEVLISRERIVSYIS